MSQTLRALILTLLALSLAACDGRGRVHESPPPRSPANELPDREPQTDAPYRAAPAPRTEDEFETFPGATAPPARAEAGRSWEPPAPSPPEPRTAEKSAGANALSDRSLDSPARGRGLFPSTSGRPQEPAPERRPGLATHWGESRYSPAREVAFERNDDGRPTAQTELYYNDRSGALRMLPGAPFGKSELALLGGSLRISMLDESGRPFPALKQGGRTVSMGDPGERYSLLIENRTGDRFEVVATVDGLDVLDGEDGSLDKRGYLIGAYASAVIDGFRRSDEEVAAFRLGDVAHSYAASKGKARNVGVIGFALFVEKQTLARYRSPRYPEPRYEGDTYQRQTAEPFPGRYAHPPAW